MLFNLQALVVLVQLELKKYQVEDLLCRSNITNHLTLVKNGIATKAGKREKHKAKKDKGTAGKKTLRGYKSLFSLHPNTSE